MRKKEREILCEVKNVLEAELLRHNKNLTKKQYYAVDDAVECIKLLLDVPDFKSDLIGKRIRIKYMAGEPSYSGREGKIEMVDDIGQLHGTWGGLAVMPGEDSFEFLDDEGCPHCGEFVSCNNGEGCDTCKYRE